MGAPGASAEQQGNAELHALVEAALRTIEDPCSESLKAGWSVLDLGLLVDAEIGPDGDVVVELTLTDPMCPFFEMLERRVCEAVSNATGRRRVSVHVSSRVAWGPGRAKRGPLRVS